jgi:hypothetical protein
MRKTSTIFSLVIAMTIFGGSMVVSAQGRGNDRKEKSRNHSGQGERNHGDRDRDNDRDDRRGNDRHDHDDRYAGGRHGHGYGHHNHGRNRYYGREVHYHNPRPVIVHHHVRPRYVYYRDYDVYYDCDNSVYISFSGRGWTVTREIPRSMRYVDVKRVKRYRVDYYYKKLTK